MVGAYTPIFVILWWMWIPWRFWDPRSSTTNQWTYLDFKTPGHRVTSRPNQKYVPAAAIWVVMYIFRFPTIPLFSLNFSVDIDLISVTGGSQSLDYFTGSEVLSYFQNLPRDILGNQRLNSSKADVFYLNERLPFDSVHSGWNKIELLIWTKPIILLHIISW